MSSSTLILIGYALAVVVSSWLFIKAGLEWHASILLSLISPTLIFIFWPVTMFFSGYWPLFFKSLTALVASCGVDKEEASTAAIFLFNTLLYLTGTIALAHNIKQQKQARTKDSPPPPVAPG